ncbi:MAG: hypothetical protein KKF22_16470 [Gammaproteobacteria bacterium]|nr:hypothetical protein [Gammaproteobacteria bacterium]
MQINLNTPNTAATSTTQTVVPAAQTKTTTTAAPSAADTVTLSAESKAKLAAELQQEAKAAGPTVTTLGSGWGNEPPK